ncbi:MarR family winged helix-turn-helix transcriptional regulator [Companilactobacillus sp.]|jgi:DNA-binding MarR family transcriptional regulator|uniref:MarR family winged helix-turn-helix transcriptional regulator n=1 Tax=Companilactobacillus sp. TaxID=2767905 RepID=UPI0025BC5010|nr:MarR family transcriptional regulator [Companilactobacillus sp.]MCH4008720.1 MarR family transcriptional regulator [Companilactobacillus sp.]MCH4051101.1 MarR family transcriptional regulator [Companilactobacillus sp.]MCH4076663.1 MarR family transcriptional regulator [Companilactobacillus sp.]MCH4125238.1 MarR family transcriptional regulator [Companilactobacillus sp.]MCH4131778.1 MarR family transcriptional regulator [Companilactobacillus sp.]
MLSIKQISLIRSFNREYTTTLGLLNRDVFDTTLSFPESRVLLQISESKQITPKEISNRLDLDASYASRLIKKLDKLGYLIITQSPIDARSKIIELSKIGKSTVEELDEDSNVQIQNLISNLDESQQKDLYQSFKTINTLLFKKEEH